jgi:hypothetical protein
MNLHLPNSRLPNRSTPRITGRTVEGEIRGPETEKLGLEK